MKKIMLFCALFLVLFSACSRQAETKRRIAILMPVTHPSMEQIAKGFVETMKTDHPEGYRFDIYNAQGNKTLMRSEIEEIIRKDYDLVCTLGTLGSQMTTEVFSRKRISTPIVFTCVNDPVGFHIVASENSSGNMATGVKELLDLRQELAYLLHYKPSIKSILLVYNPTEAGLEKDQKQLYLFTQQMNINLISIEVFQTSEMLVKVPPFIEKADAVLVLKDNTVVSGLDCLVKLCNKHHIPLMASDLDSPDKGAAFGYGVYEIEFGKQAAQKALLILNQGLKPSDIPVTAVSGFTLRINEEAAIQQGVSHDHLFH